MPAFVGRAVLSACIVAVVVATGCSPRARTGQLGPILDGTAAATVFAPSPSPRPVSVPITARLVSGELRLGDSSPAAGTRRESEDLLYAVQCTDDVLTVSTTSETLYAEFSCDKALPDEVFRPYLSQPVSLTSFDTAPRQLHIASGAVGDVGFAVGDLWLIAR